MGLTLLTKLSAVAFLPVCFSVAAFVHRRPQAEFVPFRTFIFNVGLVVLLAGNVVWAGYRFSVGPIDGLEVEWDGGEVVLERIEKTSEMLEWLMHVPVPAPEFARGLLVLAGKNEAGHTPYFMGAASGQANLAFFPVVVFIKLPISFACLFGVSVLIALRHGLPRNAGVPIACLIAILGLAMAGKINLGVRHVLPLFPLLAIVISLGISRVWQGSNGHFESTLPNCVVWPASRLPRACVIVLVSLGVAESMCAHPDYLAYFNACAGANPEYYVVDSDLDWGQDLERLALELRRRNISRVYLAYFGTADIRKHGLPECVVLEPGMRVQGYVAISMSLSKEEVGYEWLNEHRSVTKIGKSIILYNCVE